MIVTREIAREREKERVKKTGTKTDREKERHATCSQLKATQTAHLHGNSLDVSQFHRLF